MAVVGVSVKVLLGTDLSLGERGQARGRRAPHGGGGALEARALDVGEDVAQVRRVHAHAEQPVHVARAHARLDVQLLLAGLNTLYYIIYTLRRNVETNDRVIASLFPRLTFGRNSHNN